MRDIYIETMKKIMFITSLVLVLLFIQSSAASAANVPYGPNWPHSVTISKIIPSWSNTNYIFTWNGNKSARFDASTNSWFAYPDAPFAIDDMVHVGNHVIAIGRSGGYMASSYITINGASWTSVPVPYTGTVQGTALAHGADGYVWALGAFQQDHYEYYEYRHALLSFNTSTNVWTKIYEYDGYQSIRGLSNQIFFSCAGNIPVTRMASGNIARYDSYYQSWYPIGCPPVQIEYNPYAGNYLYISYATSYNTRGVVHKTDMNGNIVQTFQTPESFPAASSTNKFAYDWDTGAYMGMAYTANGVKYYKNDIITGAVTTSEGMGDFVVNRLFFSPGGYALQAYFDPDTINYNRIETISNQTGAILSAAASAQAAANNAAGNALNAYTDANYIRNTMLSTAGGVVQDASGTVLEEARQAKASAQTANTKLDNIQNSITNIQDNLGADTTPPELELRTLSGANATSGNSIRVLLDISDNVSQAFTYSIDNVNYNPVPDNNVITLPVTLPGTNIITVRVKDQAGNTGTKSISIRKL